MEIEDLAGKLGMLVLGPWSVRFYFRKLSSLGQSYSLKYAQTENLQTCKKLTGAHDAQTPIKSISYLEEKVFLVYFY